MSIIATYRYWKVVTLKRKVGRLEGRKVRRGKVRRLDSWLRLEGWMFGKLAAVRRVERNKVGRTKRINKGP
jgi:hypothetical protein